MRKKIFRLGATLLAGIFIISAAGCNKNESKETNETNTELVVGEAVDFVSYDTMGSLDGQGFTHYSKMVYEPLVDYENGEAVPLLAESWENDGNTWTFYLREGVTFTDGTAFNAEAVKLNIEMLNEHMADMISYYGGVSRITAIHVIDDHTISFEYEEPYYAVLQDLSSAAFGMMSPALFEDGNVPYCNVTTATAGTGSYILDSEDCTVGTSYTFTRNEEYYNEITGPDQFTIKIITDADSRMMALESGEIDFLYGSYQITYDMFDYLAKVEGVEAEQSETVYATRNLLLNTASEILSDANVRKAMEYGINKEQINDTILHGLEEPADTLFPLTMEYCDVEQTIYEYDPELAARLLDEAGWNETNEQGIRVKDGVSLSLEVIYMSERTADEQILMAFKGQMEEIGIEIVINGYETNTWFEKGLMGEFDISVNDTYGFPQDPQVFVAAMLDYGLDYPAQQGLSQKSEIDSQISAMLSTADETIIRQAYEYVFTTLQDEAVNIPIANKKELAIYNSDKVESVYFADEAAYCDISKIVMK
ncbi:MAG: ABC transporter substrate-binding protein [Lachnospiraceae bacterium]